MKTTLTALASLALAACAHPVRQPPPSIYGDWIYVSSDGCTGTGLSVKEDGTYVLSQLELTSPNSANVQNETGTFDIVASGNAEVTPQQSSCRGPDPAFHVTFDVIDGDLEVAFPTGVTLFQPNTAAPSGSFADTLGCFASTGFAVQPLAPVQ